MQGLQPESWQRGNMDAELDRAITAIEDAEEEFGKVTRRLASVLPGEHSAVDASQSSATALPKDFMTWMRFGLAFTLPLIAALLVFSLITHFTH